MKRAGKEILVLLFVVVMVAITAMGFGRSSETSVEVLQTEHCVVSSAAVSEALGKVPTWELAEFTMDGLYVGGKLPIDFDEAYSRVKVVQVEMGSSSESIFSLAGGSLEVDGKVVLGANATLEDCYAALGDPDGACEHLTKWILTPRMIVRYNVEAAFDSHSSHHLELCISHPHYCEVRPIGNYGR